MGTVHQLRPKPKLVPVAEKTGIETNHGFCYTVTRHWWHQVRFGGAAADIAIDFMIGALEVFSTTDDAECFNDMMTLITLARTRLELANKESQK